MTKKLKIVSGGQTGVDRAGLDIAIKHKIPYGGWCPQGGLAEDMPTPPGLLAHYPALKETSASDYYTRTRLNVDDSDVTLVLTNKASLITTGGTSYTALYAKEKNKPCYITVIKDDDVQTHTAQWLQEMISKHQVPLILNIAGPRESKSPGIYQQTYSFLEQLLAISNLID